MLTFVLTNQKMLNFRCNKFSLMNKMTTPFDKSPKKSKTSDDLEKMLDEWSDLSETLNDASQISVGSSSAFENSELTELSQEGSRLSATSTSSFENLLDEMQKRDSEDVVLKQDDNMNDDMDCGVEESKGDVEMDDNSRMSLESTTDSSFTTLMYELQESTNSVDDVVTEVPSASTSKSQTDDTVFTWGTTKDIEQQTGLQFQNHRHLYVQETELTSTREYCVFNPLREFGVFALQRMKRGVALTLFPGIYKRYIKTGEIYSQTLFKYAIEVVNAFPNTTD